jgi:hypothetical protein
LLTSRRQQIGEQLGGPVLATGPARLLIASPPALRRRYDIRQAGVGSGVYYRLANTRLELTLRSIAESYGDRNLKCALSRDILISMDVAGFGMASGTHGIVEFPLPPIQHVGNAYHCA